MLIPREKPYLEGLNSYYLHLDRFIEHMQGEIGAGGIHCKAHKRQIFIYFDENEIIRSIIQEEDHAAEVSHLLKPVEEALKTYNYRVQVFLLEPHAIFFWGKMPKFQRAKSALKSTDIPLPDLAFRLKQKEFSGFIDVKLVNKKENGVLFFNEGKRIGGSYSWGKGGLSSFDDDYNNLVSLVQADEGEFTFGSFNQESKTPQKLKTKPTVPAKSAAEKGGIGVAKVKQSVYSELRPPLEEFLFFYIQALEGKTETPPVELLKKRILDRNKEFPFLSDSRGLFEYSNGVVKFSLEAPKEKITRAVIACVWDVVHACEADDAFREQLKKMRNRQIFQEKNIPIEG